MANTRKRMMFAALYVATALSSGTALGQTTSVPKVDHARGPGEISTIDDNSLQDIVVTAQKRAQNLSDIPMSITAVSGDDLKARGITDVAGLAKITPGLSFVDSGASVPVYSLRGVGFFDQSIGARPTVSIYQNEVPLPFSIMAAGASLDLERVEVLKGPQGTLFGQNATGGAINYVAAKPGSDPSGELTFGYGRFNDVEVQGYVSGPITQGINARLAIRGERSDGWQKSYTRDDSLGSKRFLQGRATIVTEPLAGLTLTLTGNGFLDRSDTQAAQLIGVVYNSPSQAVRVPLITNYPRAPANDRAADWNDPGFPLRRNNEFYQASFRADYDVIPGLVLTSLTAFSRISVRQGLDLDGTAINAVASDNRGSASSLSQEVRLTGHSGPLNVVFGGNYARDKSDQLDDFMIPYTTTAFALPTGRFFGIGVFSRQRFSTKGIFGNADLNLGKHFVVHAGGRFNQEDLDYQACSRAADPTSAATFTGFYNILRARAGAAPISPVQVGQCISIDETLTPSLKTGELNQHNFSWRTGIDWKPAAHTLFYANVSRGYKGGSGPTLSALSNAQFKPVTQESVTAYEIGFKVGLLDNRLRLSGAGFYYDYKDKQLKSRILTSPNIFGPLEALVNVPKSHIEGLELSIDARPFQGLTVNLGATYISSKVTSAFTGFSITGLASDFRGQSFPYTPKYQGVADSQYRWQLTNSLSAFVGGSINYRSNTTASFGYDPLTKINSYTLIDLRAGLERDRYSVTIFGENVGNTYYWTNVAKINDTVRRLAGKPATYGIRINTKF